MFVRTLIMYVDGQQVKVFPRSFLVTQMLLKDVYQSIECLPPLKTVEIDHLKHKQNVKSKTSYLKKHNRCINTYNLKGCRIRY